MQLYFARKRLMKTLLPTKAFSISQRRKLSKCTHWYKTDVLPWKSQDAFVTHMLDNVIIDNGHIVAFNKPPEVPMHALKYTSHKAVVAPEEGDYSMSTALPAICKQLGVEKLKESFSQPRQMSGVLVYAKTEDAHSKLEKYFRHVRAQKVLSQHYWALTVDRPQSSEGHKEILLEWRKIRDTMMAVKVDDASETRRVKHQVICCPITFNTVDTCADINLPMSLVSLKTVTTMWDCIQLFFLHQLAPVLGDHKYSSRLKRVMDKPVLLKPENCTDSPQILPDAFYTKVGLHKSRVNLIPLHLHCSNVVLPSLDRRKKTLVELHAPLPSVYQKTLDALGLKVPDSVSVLGVNSDSIATKWKGKRAAAAEEKTKKKAEENEKDSNNARQSASDLEQGHDVTDVELEQTAVIKSCDGQLRPGVVRSSTVTPSQSSSLSADSQIVNSNINASRATGKTSQSKQQKISVDTSQDLKSLTVIAKGKVRPDSSANNVIQDSASSSLSVAKQQASVGLCVKRSSWYSEELEKPEPLQGKTSVEDTLPSSLQQQTRPRSSSRTLSKPLGKR